MKPIRLFLPILFVGVMSIAACKKDKTAGPAGPTGATGAQGATGATGAAGSAGNANVSSYVLVDQSVVAAGFTILSIPAITQSIVDQGIVLVYLRNTGSTGAWYPIPYSESGNTITLDNFGVGYVDLKANFTDANAFDFRVVVIPGSALTQLNVTNPSLNFRNFTVVARALHLSN